MRIGLPLRITEVGPGNLLLALEAVRGCLKTTSMLWMHALHLPVLPGVVVGDWSAESARCVRQFCIRNHFSELLLRVDKRRERWTKRRGGYIVGLTAVPDIVRELAAEGMVAVLLEPASPYADQYSLAAIADSDRANVTVEVVGPGFDASDILRSDIAPHERWVLPFDPLRGKTADHSGFRRVSLVDDREYLGSVEMRLQKIGARLKNPAFPTEILEIASERKSLAEAATKYLRGTHQTLLLRNAGTYRPIPKRHLATFANHIFGLLSGLASYGIHLGPTSFAASFVHRRGLVFWDFFPARKRDEAMLYPAH